MPESPIRVDYLVIGAGAMGLAFADTLIAESKDCTVAIVDRNHAPGGHWTVSYPFVRLHGPSAVYGVDTRPMPSDVSREGNLASRNEILGYYDTVMRDDLLASGRVVYLPSHEVEEVKGGAPTTARARSVVTGTVVEVEVQRRVVDATYLNNTVPAMGRSSITVDEGVRFIPINGLTDIQSPPQRFTVIGAGKTGLDACLWLLGSGVDPGRITWVAPRTAWLVNRDHFGHGTILPLMSLAGQPTPTAVIHGLEESGALMRLDPAVEPTGFRCATVSQVELAALRTITDIVRLGHVRRISRSGMELDDGFVDGEPDTVYVDCTADGLALAPLVPVFGPGTITLQALLPCLVPISGGLTAHLEVVGRDDAQRNELAIPVRNPHAAIDVLKFYSTRLDRLIRWADSPLVGDWLKNGRLGNSLAYYTEIAQPGVREQADALIRHFDTLLPAAG